MVPLPPKSPPPLYWALSSARPNSPVFLSSLCHQTALWKCVLHRRLRARALPKRYQKSDRTNGGFGARNPNSLLLWTYLCSHWCPGNIFFSRICIPWIHTKALSLVLHNNIHSQCSVYLHVLSADGFLGTKSLSEWGAMPARSAWGVCLCKSHQWHLPERLGYQGTGGNSSEIHLPRF